MRARERERERAVIVTLSNREECLDTCASALIRGLEFAFSTGEVLKVAGKSILLNSQCFSIIFTYLKYILIISVLIELNLKSLGDCSLEIVINIINIALFKVTIVM